MDQITRIRLEAWVDDSPTRGTERAVCAPHVDRERGCEGLRYVWFVMEDKELHGLGNGSVRSLDDGMHHLYVSFGQVIFYDMEIPRDAAGKMSVPFLRLEVPTTFWRYLERLARVIWNGLRQANRENTDNYYHDRGRRIEIEIPVETFRRFQRNYGQGKGEIVRQYSERLMSEMKDRPKLKERVEWVEKVGLNYSQNRYHSIITQIQNDGDGYYFSFRDHKGRRGLCGGIVNHSKEKSHDDWSIHT